nr:hypothetical protein [Staphylococcus aureus]
MDIFSIILSTISFSGIILGLNMMAEMSFAQMAVWGPLLIGILMLIFPIEKIGVIMG